MKRVVFTGGSGEEIIVPGTTTFDANPTALTAIHGFWTSPQLDFVSRVWHLSGFDDGPQSHGPFHLVFGETVHDDGVLDTVFGNTDDDWLFAV